jgi:hypothetical protein
MIDAASIYTLPCMYDAASIYTLPSYMLHHVYLIDD